MLVLFDVDGTLVRSFMREGGGGQSQAYDLIEVLPGRRERVRKLALDGCVFGIVTNQGGVAMGHQTPEQVWRKMGAVVAALDGFYGQPVSLHVCMHHPKAKLPEWRMDPCPRRKPGSGMIVEALEAHAWPWNLTIFVGDMDSDRDAADEAMVKYADAEAFFGVSA